MKKVLLSHDGKMKMYLVPDDVADNLKILYGFWLRLDKERPPWRGIP